jgi:hypothetical protein
MLLRSEEGLPESGWQNKVADVEQKPSGLTAIALTIFKVLAIPTVIMGCVSIYDLLIATPQHDTTTVVGKYVDYGYKGSHAYQLQVKGHRDAIPVPLWFYDDCSLHDTVELSLSPIFKYPHQISLIRNGVVEAKTTPSGKYVAIFFMAFGPFLPILLLCDQFAIALVMPLPCHTNLARLHLCQTKS